MGRDKGFIMKECIYQIVCHEDQKIECQVLTKKIMKYRKVNTIEIVKEALEKMLQDLEEVK